MLCKTLPIRLKQGAFKLFNAVRAARKGQFIQSAQHIGRAPFLSAGRIGGFLIVSLLSRNFPESMLRGISTPTHGVSLLSVGSLILVTKLICLLSSLFKS